MSFGTSLSGGASRGAPVIRRAIQVGGAPFAEYATSTTVMRDDLLAFIQASSPAFARAKAEQIQVEIRTCSGGGGGGWGGSSGYGGHPGVIADAVIMLADIEATGLEMTIGAGAGSGQDGGVTTVSTNGIVLCQSPSTKRGGNNDTEELSFHYLMHVRGGRLLDRTQTSTATNTFTRATVPLGPGGGGAHANLRPRQGGYSSFMFSASARAGGDDPGTSLVAPDGLNALPDDWNSYGGGGAGNPNIDGLGGNGGFPGGGGGGSRFGAYQPNKGRGADGSVRLRFSLFEIG